MTNDYERRIQFLASALEQANDTLRGRMDELSLVRRVGDAISQHTSLWPLSSEIASSITETINCKFAMIYAGPDSHTFDLQATSSVFSSDQHFPKSIRGTALIRALEQTHSPIMIGNVGP